MSHYIKILLSPLFFIFLSPYLCLALDSELSVQFARKDENILGLITYTIPQEYHAYSHEPGESGKPTTLDFALENSGSMKVLYTAGTEENDIYDKRIKTRVYNGKTSFLVILPVDSIDKTYEIKLDMLLCSNKRCMPIKKTKSGKVPANPPLLSDCDWQIPELLTILDDYTDKITLEEGKAPQPIAIQTAKQKSEPQLEKPVEVLVSPEEFDLRLEPKYFQPELEIYSFGKALILGLIAGLILNAMPCVLPVLALKVNGLLLAGNLSNKEKIRLFRKHNLFFAAGVLTLFTILAFLLGAADLMWGQLYQSQTLLVIMLLLVFMLGLSMLGVFTLPAIDLHISSNTSNTSLQSYFSGLLCTFLATPCSGPLLGGVLAWAFTQPLMTLVAVFWAVGLGMSLPYLLFCIWPQMVHALPRPGNWMYVFEHILGFLLLGTALYLLSILPAEKRMHILSALLFIAFLSWLWGRFCGLTAPIWRRRTGSFLGIIALVLIVSWIIQPISKDLSWQIFEPAQFAEELGEKNILVEFTADWCPNCKYLETTVLTEKNLAPLKKMYNLRLIKVDLTNPSPYAEKLLSLLGGKSIPLTAIFSRGKKYETPLVLRDIYGIDTLKKALIDNLSDAMNS